MPAKLSPADEGKPARVWFAHAQVVGGKLVLTASVVIYRVDPDCIWLLDPEDDRLVTVVPADVEFWEEARMRKTR